MKGRRNLTFGDECTLAPGAAPWIGEALAQNTSLVFLNINEINGFGDEGAVALAEALKTNKHLQECYVGSTAITDEGAIALAEALKVNSTLLVLNIACNPIGDAGALAMAEALKVNTTLTLFSLIGCEAVGEEAIQALKACRTATRRCKVGSLVDMFDEGNA